MNITGLLKPLAWVWTQSTPLESPQLRIPCLADGSLCVATPMRRRTITYCAACKTLSSPQATACGTCRAQADFWRNRQLGSPAYVCHRLGGCHAKPGLPRISVTYTPAMTVNATSDQALAHSLGTVKRSPVVGTGDGHVMIKSKQNGTPEQDIDRRLHQSHHSVFLLPEHSLHCQYADPYSV
jgi:hypothetical protein